MLLMPFVRTSMCTVSSTYLRLFDVLCINIGLCPTTGMLLQREQVCGVPLHWGKVPAAMQWGTESCWECCQDRRRCVGPHVQSDPKSLDQCQCIEVADEIAILLSLFSLQV